MVTSLQVRRIPADHVLLPPPAPFCQENQHGPACRWVPRQRFDAPALPSCHAPAVLPAQLGVLAMAEGVRALTQLNTLGTSHCLLPRRCPQPSPPCPPPSAAPSGAPSTPVSQRRRRSSRAGAGEESPEASPKAAAAAEAALLGTPAAATRSRRRAAAAAAGGEAGFDSEGAGGARGGATPRTRRSTRVATATAEPTPRTRRARGE